MLKLKEKEMPRLRQNIPVKQATPEQGLNMQQVKDRLDGGWANGTPEGAGMSVREIVLHHCLTFFNLVFVVLAVVLVLVGSSVKNMTFLGAMICNTVIGIVQQVRSKRAVDKLTLVAAGKVRTVRDGKVQSVRTDKLVRDDIVEFVAGNQICADGVLLTGKLQVNESLITGEEDAITKLPGDELKSGSFVIAGVGRTRLTKVGGDSFAAKLAQEAKANPKVAKSEMMRALDGLIRVVGFTLIPIGVFLFIQQWQLLELSVQDSAQGTVSALIGMVPEGLYLLTSVAMAASALKLTRKKVLVQDMNCIETLARVDVLCVDKTGTITENKMEVDNVIPLTYDAPEHLERVLSAIYSGVEPENDTARAMAEMFAVGTDWKCVGRVPFTSKTKWSAATFRDQGSFVVGAPEFVMGSRYEELRADVESWSATGCRVLLVAEYAGDPQSEQLVAGHLRPLALILLTNRIRRSAPDTFRYFEEQGVTIKVISGDNPVTVSEVARRAGIRDAGLYIDAGQLETGEDFLTAVDEYTVFGRVTPDKKKKLIQALKKRGHTVAMTGDGVNDVLAMKESDCGIAMASGSQAASQVAQLVLLNNNFAAMPSIVGEGRRVINNIQRAATLFLAKNIFSLGLSIITLVLQWPYPLEPIHWTMISTLTIGIPSFFLAMEPNYERVKGRFLPGVFRRALPGGLTNIFVVLMALAFMAVFGLELSQTGAICAAILSVVGLQILFQICKPFDRFRKIIWWAMAAGLAICFIFFGGFFELRAGGFDTTLVMAALVIMSPTVFFAVQRVFDWGDWMAAWFRKRLKRK